MLLTISFSILIAGNQLVHLAKSKKYSITSEDLLLLTNFVNSSESMRNSETWTPVCLPGFSARGYLYAYIHFLHPRLCLIMICINQTEFFECSNAKTSIDEELTKTNIKEHIVQMSKTPHYHASDLKIPNLRHFVYRNNSLSQFTTPAFTAPYNSIKERKRLIRTYKTVRENLLQSKSNTKVYFHMSSKECIVGFHTSQMELHAALSLTISKNEAISICDLVKKWIKREEDKLFIPYYPSW